MSMIFSNLGVANNKTPIMITESEVTEIFCIADDFCKEFEIEMARQGHNGMVRGIQTPSVVQ